jgi:hypothetical protein
MTSTRVFINDCKEELDVAIHLEDEMKAFIVEGSNYLRPLTYTKCIVSCFTQSWQLHIHFEIYIYISQVRASGI